MIAMGHYLVFIIALVGMTLSVNATFSERDIHQFLNYILELHNEARRYHGVADLLRTDDLDAEASEIHHTLLIQGPNYPVRYDRNVSNQFKNESTELNKAAAQNSFSEWYNSGNKYCYFFEPLDGRFSDQFTRIVWRNTTHIGMTFYTWNDTYTVLVIYDPPGNIKGQYTSNVMLPPSLATARNPHNNMLLYQGDEERFLYYILELHNKEREKKGKYPLTRDKQLDGKASTLLYDPSQCPRNYRMITLVRNLDLNFKMDAAEAEEIFSEWCNDKDAYTEIIKEDAARFGIAMEIFDSNYKILAVFIPPSNRRFRFMGGGSSSYN